MQKVRISAVSYINTSPFIWGIQQKEIINKIKLSLNIPSECAKKLIDNDVDIGLIPIVVLPELIDGKIISEYCIGATGNVGSVFLVGNSPIKEIKIIYIDSHSRTSIVLANILAKKYWGIKPTWKSSPYIPASLLPGEAAVVIGDKTFKLQKQFKFNYDLSAEWFAFTDMPFVFAAWVANKKIDLSFLKEFNEALYYGIQNIDSVVKDYPDLEVTASDVKQYLTKNISYTLDNEKQKGLNLFLKYVSEINNMK